MKIRQELKNALSLQELGKYSQALNIYKKELNNNLNLSEQIFTYTNMANIYFLNKDFELSIQIYKKALQINPKHQQVLYNLGVVFLQLEKYNDALGYLKQSKIINSQHYPTILNLAICYKNLNDFQKSFDEYSYLLSNQQYEADIFYNLGNLYLAIEQYSYAIKNYLKALKKEKSNYLVLYSIGLCYHKIQKNNKAIKYFDKSLQYEPKNYDCLFAKSLACLQLGDYKTGWNLYRYRFQAKNDLKQPIYPIPYFNGEDLENKTILVQAEQGFGDNIQFCRYLCYLKGAKKVYFATKKPLAKLIADSFSYVSVCGDKDELNGVDYCISLMDLPRIYLDKDIFQDISFPYIKLQKKANLIEKTNKIKIGFCWEGNKEHKNNHNRSIPFEYFLNYINMHQNIIFYSFQKEYDIEIPILENLIDLGEKLIDFSTTANFIEQMDCMICIDSAVAHLSGALGKKTFLLLPKYNEWRWLQDTNTTKWYPSLELIRQTKQKNWDSVFQTLEDRLCKI